MRDAALAGKAEYGSRICSEASQDVDVRGRTCKVVLFGDHETTEAV